MKLVYKQLIAVFCFILFFSAIPVLAEDTTEELAKASEAACVATASTKPTPQMIMDKVEKACALLQKEGVPAFSKLQGKDSEFIFAGTYIDPRYGGRDAHAPDHLQTGWQERPQLEGFQRKALFYGNERSGKNKGCRLGYLYVAQAGRKDFIPEDILCETGQGGWGGTRGRMWHMGFVSGTDAATRKMI